MDELKQVIRKAWLNIFTVITVFNLIIMFCLYYAISKKWLRLDYNFYIAILFFVILNFVYFYKVTRKLFKPFETIWQTIAHLNQNSQIEKPDIESLKIAHSLTENLTKQITQMSISKNQATLEMNKEPDLKHNFIAKNLPIPLLVLDNSENIIFANEEFARYIGLQVEDIINKNFYMIVDMSFPSEDTFDVWLKDSKLNRATALKSWVRVRIAIRDNHPIRLFDLAAYYNRDNSFNETTIITIFDHTKQYLQDDNAIGFVALSVHELRTPLTLLRGYAEAIKEELGNNANQQAINFLSKLDVSAKQMTSFVNNILNVARIDNDQLELKLQPEDWSNIITDSVSGMLLRAKIREIEIKIEIEPNLPLVGVDRISIYEVISNLIDNAIKYSGSSKEIILKTYLNRDGLVETLVQDFGLGISENILSNLFTKYYRDHHNRAQIGGTGLGLYLSKAIISAHGGNIWVTSKIDHGSIFYFTLIPFEKLTADLKENSNQSITTTAHGWIKNHSLYRR